MVMFAHTVAVAAEACYEGCMMARQGEWLGERLPSVALKDWFRLYDQPRVVMEAGMGGLKNLGENTDCLEAFRDIHDGAAEIARMGKRRVRRELREIGWEGFVEACREAQKAMDALYAAHLEGIRQAIAEPTAPFGSLWQEVGRPEVQFFLRVYWPCRIEYGVAFEDLLRQARAGDIAALENLLRLDKAALEDRKVREHYHKAVSEGNAARVKRLNDALAGQPLRRLTPQKVKVSLAGLVHKYCAQWDRCNRRAEKIAHEGRLRLKFPKVALTAPDIQRLFDAVSLDFKGHPDTDLTPSPHGFYMALKREWEFWPDIPGVSQKS
jgi:hypothetical protein